MNLSQNDQTVFYVGTVAEVGHHARPLQSALNIQIVEPEKVVESAGPGDVAIFCSEHFDRFRNACSELKKSQVATIYAIDGILEWRNAWENRHDEPACPWTMRPVLSHKVACISRQQAKVLDRWGNRGKTEVVGIPRFDQLRPLTNRKSKQTFRLLVMTAKWPGFTAEQVATTVQSLSDLRDFVSANPETADGRPIEIIWRLTGDLEKQLNVPNQLTDISGNELASVLRDVDAVVTTPSTAILESMLLGLPTAVLDYHNCPEYVSSPWAIKANSHIDSVMQQLARPAANRMLYQESILAEQLECQSSATTRMVELIQKVQVEAIECLRNNNALQFSSHMISLEPVGQSHLELSQVFPEQPEFQNQDSVELQTELAHARREIKHLQAQINQLSGELGQAHEIFEQIHRHPVAGPIVRARQRILDFFTQLGRRKANPESVKHH